jgi:hypothetical protein
VRRTFYRSALLPPCGVSTPCNGRLLRTDLWDLKGRFLRATRPKEIFRYLGNRYVSGTTGILPAGKRLSICVRYARISGSLAATLQDHVVSISEFL